MLQKIFVVLVGIVMSIVGALSPAGMFASESSLDIAPLAAKGTTDEVVATVRTLDGAAFAKVSVLWVEVDGRRVTDDAWGTGTVDELRFKVGVKTPEGLALAVGDRLVPLSPTDVLTVRMFHGEFAFRSMGSPEATLQLQGTVKSALVSDGVAGSRLRTEQEGVPQVIEPPRGGARDVAYVVLTTGQKVDTVSVADGGARIFTEEALDGAKAADAPGNLLAKWVKVDGRLLQEYTWGDGPVSTIEFEPADAGKGGVVLAFNGEPTEVPAGSRVVVTDFVGEHLVYQVTGGLVRLRLDGYAADMQVGAATSLPVQLGAGAPVARFKFEPSNPNTTDTIRFTDLSNDDTAVVLRVWRFGDQGTSVLQNPTFRFTEPGTYIVTLNVTDTDRQQSETSLPIEVGNAAPVPDFDFWPKIVTTDTRVAFTDESTDTDGQIVSWSWTFGDGATSDARHPTHSFNRSGETTVTLTTRDNLGAEARLSKVVHVRNTPPAANFTYAPTDVQTLLPIRFVDHSVDKDGIITQRVWKFGDGENATGPSPEHVFKRPGLYTVSLTVTDNEGGSDTATTQVFVRNRLPIVNFSWFPRGAPADTPVLFTSLSNDLDGTILVYEWSFGDGTTAIEQNPRHFFPRAGTYNVTLTTTDNSLERNSSTQQVHVANARPVADISIGPSPAFRGVEISFADVSTDADGDRIVNRTWRIDNGAPQYEDQIIRRTFNVAGEHVVNLTVVDAANNVAWKEKTFRVVNRPPVLDGMNVTPVSPLVDQPVTFTASGRDLDAQPGDPPLNYTWTFNDGTVLHGEQVIRRFHADGLVTVRLRATDADNATSNPIQNSFVVDYAVPLASFVWSPTVPIVGETVRFENTSTSLNGAITGHRWSFKDGTFAEGPVVFHNFTTPGTQLVKLTVTDERSRSGTIELPIVINGRPTASFDMSPNGLLPRGTPVVFTDTSQDSDGDAITAWSWDFGDGSSSNAQHPVHNFTQPGRHNVTLTVTDARGATDTTTKQVRIENARPVARFTAPLSVNANAPVTFSDQSFDPDNTPVLSWFWNFGDGTTSTEQHPTHTYLRSGRYAVSLVVSDGELQSPATVRSIDVTASHPTSVLVRATLPDGRSADLTGAPYQVRARIANPGSPPTDITNLVADAPNLRVPVNAGSWMSGSSVNVTITAPSLFPGSLSKTWTLQEVDGISRFPELPFEVPLMLSATVTPEHGSRDTTSTLPIVVPNDNRTIEGDPVYRSLSEAFRGTGTVRMSDGWNVTGASVILEARYLPIRAAGAARDGLGAMDGNLLGWCRAATAATDADGRFSWVMDHRSDCTLQEAGLHPVGRWEIRARASFSFAISAVSPTATVYVDPTGGLLWALSSPP